MKIANKIATGVGILFLVFAITCLRPVPIVAESECEVVQGEVTSISEGGVKDVLFRLKDHPTRFYINRGLESGLNLEELRSELMGKIITIKYPSYWTPLDWNNRIKHIAKVEYEDKVFFNEMTD